MNEYIEIPDRELNEIDLAEIAKLITEGYTSGILDDGDKNIHWEFKAEVNS